MSKHSNKDKWIAAFTSEGCRATQDDIDSLERLSQGRGDGSDFIGLFFWGYAPEGDSFWNDYYFGDFSKANEIKARQHFKDALVVIRELVEAPK